MAVICNDKKYKAKKAQDESSKVFFCYYLKTLQRDKHDRPFLGMPPLLPPPSCQCPAMARDGPPLAFVSNQGSASSTLGPSQRPTGGTEGMAGLWG